MNLRHRIISISECTLVHLWLISYTHTQTCILIRYAAPKTITRYTAVTTFLRCLKQNQPRKNNRSWGIRRLWSPQHYHDFACLSAPPVISSSSPPSQVPRRPHLSSKLNSHPRVETSRRKSMCFSVLACTHSNAVTVWLPRHKTKRKRPWTVRLWQRWTEGSQGMK